MDLIFPLAAYGHLHAFLVVRRVPVPRTFDALDEGDRDVLAIDIASSLPSRRVTAILDQLIGVYRRPTALRLDNAPEIVARCLADWGAEKQIHVGHNEPGQPNQNAFIERLYGPVETRSSTPGRSGPATRPGW